MPSIYQVPMLLEQQKLVPLVRKFLALDQVTIPRAMTQKGDKIWTQWKTLTGNDTRFHDPVTVALVGKYVELQDSYLSVVKSLEHAAMRCKRKLDIRWIDSDHLEPKMQQADPAKFHNAWHEIVKASGILVPGGFGSRATEGMVAAATWAREHKKPYLGVCLGMQIAVIEYARNVCGCTRTGKLSRRDDPLMSNRVGRWTTTWGETHTHDHGHFSSGYEGLRCRTCFWVRAVITCAGFTN